MPGIHSPIARHFITLDGAVLQSGGSKNLAKGQFTIVKKSKATTAGAVVASSFAGVSDSEILEMRLGKSKVPTVRDGVKSLPHASGAFTVKDVVSVKANFPRVTEQIFDKIVVGYDGINANTAITIDEGQNTVLDIILRGEPVEYYTGEDCYKMKFSFAREEGQTMQEVIYNLIEQIKKHTIAGTGIPVTTLIDVKPSDSLAVFPEGTPYVVSTLTVTDEGGSNAIARVQTQYPAYRVQLQSRNGLESVYSILHPQASALTDYSAVVNSSYIKGCAACIAGYTTVSGGFVYSVSVEDDGVDQTTAVDNIAGFVTGSVIRHGNEGGRGLYTVMSDREISEAELATYIASAPVLATATVELLGDVATVCAKSATTTIAWVDGTPCYATVENYKIQLKDTNCGSSRLTELQAYYPNLVIEEGNPTGNATRTVTLTGTSGTANINVGGTNYLATFATDLTTTATNFDTTHSAALLSAYGVTVTAAGAVLTFTAEAEGFPNITVTNASSNLAGTLGTIDYVASAQTGGCQRVYSTQVVTNVVCEDCSPVFTDVFTSTAPEDFDFISWELVRPAYNGSSLMGIVITAKPFKILPTDISRDQIPFYETSVEIEAAGGYIETSNLSFQPIYNNSFSVRKLSARKDRDALGYHLLEWEDVANTWFENSRRHKNNQFARAVLGEESVLKFDKQYVTVEVTVRDTHYSQGFGGRSDRSTTYIIAAELGYHANLVSYINKLAARAGVEGIRPVAI